MIPRVQAMDTPKTRTEFELRFHQLTENINKKNIQYPLDIVESLLRLRRLPNGRLDFLSVDESARLQANTMHAIMAMREKLLDQEVKNTHSEE